MYAIFLGVGVGVGEFLIDKLRGIKKAPIEYFKDMGWVFLGMTLLKLLEKI